MKFGFLTAVVYLVALPAWAENDTPDRTATAPVVSTQGLQIGGLSGAGTVRTSAAMAILTATAATQTASSGTK